MSARVRTTQGTSGRGPGPQSAAGKNGHARRCPRESASGGPGAGSTHSKPSARSLLQDRGALSIGTLILTAAAAMGQPLIQPCQIEPPPPLCHTIHFNDLPVGTHVSNQYLAEGVTFSLSCNGVPVGSPVTANWPYLTTSSSSPVLMANSGPGNACCITATFSPPQEQNRVRVRLSQACAEQAPCSQITVIAHFAGGGSASTTVAPFCVYIPGTGMIALWECVSVFDPNCPECCTITSLDICAECPEQFAIDDLEFGFDLTEPVVSLYTPVAAGSPMRPWQTVCDTGTMDVWGTSCDADSCSLSDILRIRSYDWVANTPAPGVVVPWTDLASQTRAAQPCPTPAQLLYSYPVSNLPFSTYPEGRYQIEVEATNACGQDTADNTLYCLDRNPPTATLTCPDPGIPYPPGMIVRDTLAICGTVWDYCQVDFWYLAVSDPIWVQDPESHIISTGNSGNNGFAPLGSWDTTQALDGPGYMIDLWAYDTCGRDAYSPQALVTVDNTDPVAELVVPGMNPCPPAPYICFDDAVRINGVAYDDNIAGWVLKVSIGGAAPITLISGNTNMGTPGNPVPLFDWDTCCVPPPPPPGSPECTACCFTLTLEVWDGAQECCSGKPWPHTAKASQCGNLGQRGDYNGDGVADFDDIDAFVFDITNPCPCPNFLQCPPGATYENEPCLTDTNGGCNAPTPIFGSIACGETICGTSYFDGGTRDTDWFMIATGPTTFTVTAEAEFDLQLIVIQDTFNDCVPDATWFAWFPPFTVGTLITPPLPADFYYIWVGPQFTTTFPCTNGSPQYWVTLTCTPSDGPAESPETTDAEGPSKGQKNTPPDVSWRAMR